MTIKVTGKKRVILTKGRWSENGTFEREKYKALYEVDNIIVDETGLRFDFISRISDAQ